MDGGKMVAREKLFQKVKRNPGNVDKRLFIQLLHKFGFDLDARRGKGGHQCYYHPDFEHIPVRTVNFTKPMRKHHVLTLIRDIEEVL
ncbi:hypothetical protein KFV05_05095 [Macrococcoides canis]|uniref:hypothetical protein n=1 Tax=Macrococcoides canis TaxID=1855823 RepID=UPI0020B72096|nr:hypothetical protein [Macrococcus canis]UTH03365.1 hypothetical protein KFV05_05095 [Macrococcus canis]